MPMNALSVTPQRRVDELVGGDGVLALLAGAQCGLVDPARDLVDEAPLQHAAAHRPDLVLGVRVEIHAEPLAVGAVVRAAQLERHLERLHERGGADHVVVVERAPAGVRVLMAEQALGGEQRDVLAQVLAVHDQVLPVHVDLDVVDPLGAQLVDDVQRHPDVTHVDLHRRLGVLVLEQDLAAVLGHDVGGLPDAVDQPRPRIGVQRLERVVVTLDPGPDDEVGAQRGGELGASPGEPQRLLADLRVGRREAALAKARVDVQAGADRVDVVAVERLAHVVEQLLVELAGVVELVPVDQIAEALNRAADLRGHRLVRVVGLIAARHEPRDHRAQRPDAEAGLQSHGAPCRRVGPWTSVSGCWARGSWGARMRSRSGGSPPSKGFRCGPGSSQSPGATARGLTLSPSGSPSAASPPTGMSSSPTTSASSPTSGPTPCMRRRRSKRRARASTFCARSRLAATRRRRSPSSGTLRPRASRRCARSTTGSSPPSGSRARSSRPGTSASSSTPASPTSRPGAPRPTSPSGALTRARRARALSATLRAMSSTSPGSSSAKSTSSPGSSSASSRAAPSTTPSPPRCDSRAEPSARSRPPASPPATPTG